MRFLHFSSSRFPGFFIRGFASVCLVFVFVFLGVRSAHAIDFTVQQMDGSSPGDGVLRQRMQRLVVAIHNQVAAATTHFQFYSAHKEDLQVSCRLHLVGSERVDGFSYFNGTERIVGEVLEKKAAEQVYEELTGVAKDPGILEQDGDSFRFRVFPVQPGETKPIEIQSSQVLERSEGVLSFVVPRANLPQGDVTFSLSVDVTDDLPIDSVDVEGIQALVKRMGRRHVRVIFEGHGSEINSDITIKYRLVNDDHALRFVTHRDGASDGSFMLIVTPKDSVEDQEVIGRDILFVTDISGSMSGAALNQSKKGLATIVDKLSRDDRFDIIAFDDEPIPFYGSLREATPSAREDAMQRVNALKTRGGTNIKKALMKGLDLLEAARMAPGADPSRPQAIIFLTDGQGSNPPEVVLSEIRKRTTSVRIYSFGAGSGVNRPFLTRLAQANRGLATYIAQDNQIEGAMTRLYERISMPLMVDLKLEFDGVEPNSIYPKQLPDLYKDGEVIIFGRYTQPGSGTIKIRGRLKGEAKVLELPVEFPKSQTDHPHVEKLWAAKRVDHLLQMERSTGREELTQEITRLGIVYNLVTPYTTFLAVPESLKTDQIKEAIRLGKQGYTKRLVDTMKGIRLSQANIPPGDPVLTVIAPEDARRVVAYFPFGLVKRMDFDTIRSHWSVRFLVPRDVEDGVYVIRVLIVHHDGRHEWKEIEYTIDGTEPEFDTLIADLAVPGEDLHLEVDPFEQVRSVRAYVLGQPGIKVKLEIDPDSGTYVGALSLPDNFDAMDLVVRVVVRDRARNRHERDYFVRLIDGEEYGCAAGVELNHQTTF
jgi:Ca-activated chloride channel family protein